MAPAPKARLDKAQRPRALTTFVSTQMAAAASKKAPPSADQHKSRPIRFDAEAATRFFRFQRVTPGVLLPPRTAVHSRSGRRFRDFVGASEATGRGSAPHVRCGSHSPKPRLCQS
jgi:hypothetical protein